MIFKYFNKIKEKDKVNLFLPFMLVFLSITATVVPGTYLSYKLISEILDPEAQHFVNILSIVMPIFIGVFGLIGWIIVMLIYYQIAKFVLNISGFRKFLFIAGYLYPIKAIIVVCLTVIFFKVYGFSKTLKLEDFLYSWESAKNRIEVFSSYVYLFLLSLSISIVHKKSLGRSLISFLLPYTLWIVFVNLLNITGRL